MCVSRDAFVFSFVFPWLAIDFWCCRLSCSAEEKLKALENDEIENVDCENNNNDKMLKS